MIDIRKITKDDTTKIIKWRNNPNVIKYFLDRRPLTKESHENWLKDYVQTGKVVQFIICNLAEQKDIGSVFLKDIDMIRKTAEFGIFIGEDDQRGRGAGSKATQQIIEYAKRSLGLTSLYLRVLKKNTRAIASYQKVGFQLTDQVDVMIINGIEEIVVFMSIDLM